MRQLRCGRYALPLERPLIMGIINVTPDSFSDGACFVNTRDAIAHGWRLVEEGADLLDVGGESTRPGAVPVSLDDELQRVLPVIEALSELQVPVSVDTYKPEVMRAALAAGASMINDVTALQSEASLEIAQGSDCAICLMHMRGTPQTMQLDPKYQDVVAEVRQFLAARIAECEAAGIARDRLVVDPGFGFGKSKAHNLELLRHLDAIVQLGVPVLAGLSRKSTLGKITGKPARERVSESVAAALLAVQRGADIVRVHDVDETRDALLVLAAVERPTMIDQS
ncbi:MAG: dihydropteroate synthase [Proteobacteria bacterium]|nr:MAG: dihydropteroate synthase [Pseudomonadota bacterium]